MKHMVRLIGTACVCMVAVMVSITAHAANYRAAPIVAHWTGAQNNWWTNDANWEVEGTLEHIAPGIIPGQESARGNLGHKLDQAVFDRMPAVASRARIYLKGLDCIGNVTVTGATTPKYTFGNDTSHVLPMSEDSVLKITSDVVNTPCVYGLALGTYATKAGTNFTIWNDSPGVFEVMGWIGYIVNDPSGTYKGAGDSTFYVKGEGPVQFDFNTSSANRSLHICVQQTGAGKVIFNCKSPISFREISLQRPDDEWQVLELPAGMTVAGASGGYDQVYVKGCRAKITGPGLYRASGSKVNGVDKNGMYNIVNATDLLWIESCVTSICDLAGYVARDTPAGLYKHGAGTLRLTCPTNHIPGVLDIDGGVLEANGMGLRGTESTLGTGEGLRGGFGATFRYTGPGETTDRTLILWSGSFIVENAGSGELLLDSDVTVDSDDTSATHVLALASADGHGGTLLKPIADCGGKTVGVDVQSGVWTLTGDQTFTGALDVRGGATLALAGAGGVAVPVRLDAAGAGLRIVGGTDAALAHSLAVANVAGNNILAVTGKATVALTSVTVTGGALDIQTSDPDTEIIFAGKTSASESPAGVTLNGQKIYFSDDGKAGYGGKVTGDVDVIVDGYDRYTLAYPENDYTGITKLLGVGGASIYAMFPGSIPNYAKTSASDGRITVPVTAPGNVPGWSDAQILALANTATLTDGATVAVDPTWSGDHTIALDDSKIVNGAFGLGADGENTVTVTGDFTKKVNFSAYNGTLRLTGGTMNLGAIRATSDYNRSGKGTVILEAMTGTISDEGEPIVIGGAPNKTNKPDVTKDSYCGRMVLRNARLTNTRPTGGNALNFMVGGNNQVGSGVLEIEGADTVVTSSFCVAGNPYGCRAAVYQRDGKVVNWCSGRNDVLTGRPYFGYSSSAYYELSGGTYEQLGAARWSANQNTYMSTIFLQTGGNSIFTGHGLGTDWYMGCGYPGLTRTHRSAHARLIVRGGKALVTNINVKVSTGYNGALAEFVVDGPDAELEFASNASLQLSRDDYSATSFILNRGGSMTVREPLQCNSAEKTDAAVYVSFNGGTLRTAADGAAIFGPSAGDARTARRVTVYEKGATIDTCGNTVYAYAPIVAPTGDGVLAATLHPDINKLTMVGAPDFVQLDDASDTLGYGASLLADFDAARGVVTNVSVLCPGWNYDQGGTTRFRVCRDLESTVYCGNAPALNVSTGPMVGGALVKTGEGTLVLGNPNNTWSGGTVLEGGVLKVGAEGALPAGEIKSLGGSLDVADGVNYPSGISFDVTDADFSSGKRIVLARNWTGPVPVVKGVPDGWTVTVSGGRLSVHKEVGLLLMVR